jgi:hypothetical protein
MMTFSYTIVPVKKINVGENFKIMKNCCFSFLPIHILKLEISGCDIMFIQFDVHLMKCLIF